MSAKPVRPLYTLEHAVVHNGTWRLGKRQLENWHEECRRKRLDEAIAAGFRRLGFAPPPKGRWESAHKGDLRKIQTKIKEAKK